MHGRRAHAGARTGAPSYRTYIYAGYHPLICTCLSYIYIYVCVQAGDRTPQLLGFCDGELQRCAGSAANTAAVLKQARTLEERLLALQRADAALLSRRVAEATAAASALDQAPHAPDAPLDTPLDTPPGTL